MSENKKSSNDNKRKHEISKNSLSNYNEIMNNFISKNENKKNNIENKEGISNFKKQRLSKVFDIGEKSPYKFNEKMLRYDNFNKYISPTITPDNRKYINKKKENKIINLNQSLISPLEEEQFQEFSKINSKGKNFKIKNVENNKKKNKNKYELQFISENKHLDGTQLKDSKVFLINEDKNQKNENKTKNINIDKSLSSINDKSSNKIIKPLKESNPILIIDDNNNEKNEKKNYEIIQIDDSNSNFNSNGNINVNINNNNTEAESLSADLFKDIDNDILLSSKLSDNDIIKEDNANLIDDYEINNIIISSINEKQEGSNDIDNLDNINMKENSMIEIDDFDKFNDSNFINDINIDNYDKQIFMDNSQNYNFNESQLNKIEKDINDDNNDNEYFLSNENLKSEKDKEISTIDDIINYELVTLNKEKNDILYNNDNIIPNNSKLEENSDKTLILNKMENGDKNNDKYLKELNDKIGKEAERERINDNLQIKKNIKDQNKVNYDNVVNINNSLDDNKIESNIENNKIKIENQINIEFNKELLNDIEKKSSLIQNNSSNININDDSESKNLNNDNYKLNIFRLKSVLWPNKDHKNKELLKEYDCNCFHLNKNIMKIIVGKYATNIYKNWLIMETETSIEIWKYDVNINSIDDDSFCYWEKCTYRKKNFCEKIKDIQLSPTNEYIIIIGSNYNKKPKPNHYRCGLIIDIYTLNEIYLDIDINDLENTSSNEMSNEEMNNYFYSQICFPFKEYNVKSDDLNYEEAFDIVFIPGYENGQLIEFTIKKNLSNIDKINNIIYPIPENSSSPLLSICAYDDGNNSAVVGLMKETIAIWNIKTKEILSVILVNSISLDGNIKFISTVIPPKKYISYLDYKNNNNNNNFSGKVNNLNNYYSLISYSFSNCNTKENVTNGNISSNDDKNNNNSNDNAFGIYTFLKDQLKDKIYYQISLPDDNIKNKKITCYEDSENFIFIGYENGQIMVWEKNSKEIAAVLNSSENDNCVKKPCKVISLSFHYNHSRLLQSNENISGLLFANYENKRIIVFYIYIN